MGGPSKTLKDEVEQLARTLVKKYGPTIKVRLVDIFSPEMNSFTKVNQMIESGRVKLPVTIINGQPRFQGGIHENLTINAVFEMLKAES